MGNETVPVQIQVKPLQEAGEWRRALALLWNMTVWSPMRGVIANLTPVRREARRAIKRGNRRRSSHGLKQACSNRVGLS